MFDYPIAIGLSPNTQRDDVFTALKILFQPWRWKNGNDLSQVENWFKKYLDIKEVALFNSGRSAFDAMLSCFNIGVGDEVLLQAFTCVAVPEVVLWRGAKPVFIDIDETLNIDPGLIEKYITGKTRAIIVQHTFGVPAKIEAIKKIAQKHKIFLIEDCAHSLGGEISGQKIGTLGDAAIFSFGRDKVISSVFGGMAIISSKFKVQSSKLKKLQVQLSYPNCFWIFQQLLHPIAFGLILPLYNIYLGKIMLFLLQKLRILSKPVYKEELIGGRPGVFPKRYPNALASLLLPQLVKLDRYNALRKEIASYYYKTLALRKDLSLPLRIPGSIYLRFNILTKNGSELLQAAKRNKLILGNWYRNVIDPAGVDYKSIGYTPGSCPNAERVAKQSVNLPTYPRLTASDLAKVVSLFNAI